MPFYQTPIPPLPATASFTGQTVVITGATGGIGHELALEVLRLGAANVVLGVRDVVRGLAVRLELLADARVRAVNPTGAIIIHELDLSSFASVAAFARKVEQSEKRLDVLLLNAGINLARFEQTVDGHERCMQVNVLSNALLSLMLLPLLQRTTASHHPTITWVGSLAQGFHSPGLPAATATSGILPHYAARAAYSPLRRYPDTKLFVALFVRELGVRLQQQHGDVVANNACPGTVKTGADNALPFYLRIPMNLNRALRARSVDEGSRAVLWAVLAGQGQGSTATENGAYLADGRVAERTPFADTAEGKALGVKLFDEIVAEAQRIDAGAGRGLTLAS
ncbi:uncharacterized protein K452DRAFT_312061 [Aplosporella prunicola CBS 121167]|uniref:Ketoreductase (KR) domain-containing protein n=1 Tax=Aplosporella prunicola CBS 121167 TaxID=1176127 RepID=A0A6A6B4P9_9PEZI|nr:uncharacterized protein K452DRAFT_312061 [Aplosporella prunicola CBS 121167]KAF2137937.1 hypothetical protein K452DRAFT_312061 [Aplosporella prunicola CBS 121167]